MSRPLRSALEPSQTFDLNKRQVFRGQNQRYRLRQHDPRPDRHSRGRRSRLLLDAGIRRDTDILKAIGVGARA